jgi:hypothetical protein
MDIGTGIDAITNHVRHPCVQPAASVNQRAGEGVIDR